MTPSSTAALTLLVAMAAGALANPSMASEHPADEQNLIDGSTKYHLSFDDEFNRFESSRWITADFWGMRNNAGDYQGQWFCDPDYLPKEGGKAAHNPFIFKNGILSIVAQPTPKGVYSGPDNQPYVSGQLTSAHRFTQRYGYFELRAKVPAGKGLWSRFWLLTDDGIWPGEYDIFEILGKDPLAVAQTTHFRDIQRKHAAYGKGYKGINPTDGQFHTYGFLWEKTGVTWYVDGVATLKQINRINVPMYVLIDLVVGKDPGNLWPGNPDASNTWPTAMELDYYRVYSNDPGIPSVTPDEGYSPSTLPNGFQVVTTSTTAPLPAGWKSGDIGTSDITGSTSWNSVNDEWMLKGAGFGEQGQFAGTTLIGDGTIDATVTAASIINSNNIRAGVTCREGWKDNDKEVSLLYAIDYNDPKISHTIVFSSRINGKTVELAKEKNVDAPATLRLVKTGNEFSAFYSTDLGRTWIPVGNRQTIEMPETNQAGILVRGNQGNYRRLSRAMFEYVSVTAPH